MNKNKDYSEYKSLKRPFKINYYSNLEIIHVNKSYCSFNRLIKRFYKFGYTYKSI